MTTTAIEDWAQKRELGAPEREDASGVDESLIIGDDEHFDHDGSERVHGDSVEDDASQANASDADARANKKTQANKIFAGAGALALALVVGIGFVAYKKQSSGPLEIAGAQQPQQAQPGNGVDLQIAQVGKPTPNPESVTTERADGGASEVSKHSAAAGPDFGLPAGPAAEVAPAPLMPNRPAAVEQLPASVGVKTSPDLALPTRPAQPEASALKSESIELERLRADIASLRIATASKDEAIETLRTEVSALRTAASTKSNLSAQPRQTVRVEHAQKRVVAKAEAEPKVKEAVTPAVVVVTERFGAGAVSTPQALAVPQPVSVKGKVRTDFRVYAAVDGRFWVVGPDNEPIQVGTASPLSDGTRVTSVDVEKNVIYTNAGEIR